MDGLWGGNPAVSPLVSEPCCRGCGPQASPVYHTWVVGTRTQPRASTRSATEWTTKTSRCQSNQLTCADRENPSSMVRSTSPGKVRRVRIPAQYSLHCAMLFRAGIVLFSMNRGLYPHSRSHRRGSRWGLHLRRFLMFVGHSVRTDESRRLILT